MFNKIILSVLLLGISMNNLRPEIQTEEEISLKKEGRELTKKTRTSKN